MKIQFIGATRTTTGSMYLLEVNGKRVLLECGLYQGARAESTERNLSFPFDPSQLDAAIVSHAHLDHIGNLPNLYKQGFKGNIYCTFATRDLAEIMLLDSAHIQEADARFASKLRAKKGQPPVQPLYSLDDAEMVTRQFVSLGYDRPIPVVDGVTLTFRDAGHILGAAQVVLDVRENGRAFRYLFTGDVGRGGDPILRDPQGVEGVDVLQIESTYGAREHEARDKGDAEIMQAVLDTLKRGGKLIIPSFAVGRTQEVVYLFHVRMREESMPHVPVYVDSPLAVNATEVYRLHPECFNPEIYHFLRTVANPFEMEHLTYIRDAHQSQRLNGQPGPMIIISASGMAEAGRILHHLRNNLGDPRNLVLFIGYCAENTLGARLRAGRNPVNIFGEPCQVRARIAAVDSMSGHADRNELAAHLGRLSGDVKKIFVVHGEESQSLGFAEALRALKPQSQVYVPAPGDAVEV